MTLFNKLHTSFGVSMTFSSRIGQHLSDASRDLATLIDLWLGGCGACRWCGSSCSVCLTKFEVRRPSRSEDIGHILYER